MRAQWRNSCTRAGAGKCRMEGVRTHRAARTEDMGADGKDVRAGTARAPEQHMLGYPALMRHTCTRHADVTQGHEKVSVSRAPQDTGGVWNLPLGGE